MRWKATNLHLAVGHTRFFILDLVLSGFWPSLPIPYRWQRIAQLCGKIHLRAWFYPTDHEVFESLYLAVKCKHALEEKLLRDNTLSQLAGLARAQINQLSFQQPQHLSQLIYEDTQKAEQYVLKWPWCTGMLDESGRRWPVEPGIKVHRCLPVFIKERFGDAIQFVEDIPQEVRSRFVVPWAYRIVLENCKTQCSHRRAAFDHPHVY